MLESIATLLYGLLSIGGGIIGYVKSKSQVSLISGGISGLLLLILAMMMNLGKTWAYPVASAIISILIIVFIIRWLKTKKPIPAIPMIFFGVISIIVILS
jgi:uncharacterized membrane protein (UPF0136 family)